MTTATVMMLSGPDILPEGCDHVRVGGVLSHVQRTCTTHRTDALCVGRHANGNGLVYWCAEGRHHIGSDRNP